MKKLLEIIGEITFWIILIISMFGWGLNILQLINLDFKAPYKAEVIRTLGVVTPLGFVTGYLNIKD